MGGMNEDFNPNVLHIDSVTTRDGTVLKAVRGGWSMTLNNPWPEGAVAVFTQGDDKTKLVPVDEGVHNEVLDTWTYSLREVT